MTNLLKGVWLLGFAILMFALAAIMLYAWAGLTGILAAVFVFGVLATWVDRRRRGSSRAANPPQR